MKTMLAEAAFSKTLCLERQGRRPIAIGAMLVTAWLSTATAAPLGADRRAPTRQPGSHGLESQAPESQSLRLHANLEYLTVAKGVREAVGITLSRDQYDAIVARKIPNATAHLVDYRDYQPRQLFDAIISIGMFGRSVRGLASRTAASGMTATQPVSSSRLQAMGSSMQYTIT
jgi:hypothetical protein